MNLYDLVASTAHRHPHAVALEAPDGVLTYQSLLSAAEELGGYLTTLGEVPPRIGLIGARRARVYVAYLAILGLGRTVVPISRTAPADRVRAIAEAADLDLVLTDGDVPELDGVRVVDVPALGHSPLPDRGRRGQEPDAYILFTSGSTGRPKGVPISHASALSFIEHNIARYGVGPGDRMTQNFDLAFDVSVYDLFVAWGSGATLVAPGPMDLIHPAAWVNERAITHWASVPSAVSAAAGLGELRPDSMPSLRLSLFVGEQLTREQAESWKHAASRSAIENVYGPTELTVFISAYRLADRIDQWPETPNRTIPIGRVYDHLEAVIVADGRQADEGELCVRGPQRFAGYLDERDNAGRFLDADFDEVGSPDPRAWYRTGDLVHRRPDGSLVHLGRLDSQVKIRGYRVELHEIEGVLRLHPNVDGAVVLAVPGRIGSDELVAFYVGAPTEPRDLRSTLSRILPGYMIPPRFIPLEAFPLTSNGKVDRRALAELT